MVVGAARPALADVEGLDLPKTARDERWRSETLLRFLAGKLDPFELELLRSIADCRGGLVPVSTIAAEIERPLDEIVAGLNRLHDLGLACPLGGSKAFSWFIIPDDEYRLVDRLVELVGPDIGRSPRSDSELDL